MGRGTFRLAAAATAVTLALILAGGFVTTTRSGDAIPTWPLSWGRLVPGTADAAVWIEQSHRYIAGLAGLLVLGLALWVRATEPRGWVRRVAYLALAAVVVQALLGGWRIFVPKDQPATKAFGAGVAILHACFGQLVFAAVGAVAFFLSRAWSRLGSDDAAGGARKLGVVTCVFAFLQLVAGAVTRHTGGGIAVHLVGALLVLLHGVLLSSRLSLTSLRRGANLLMLFLGAQVILGLVSWSMTSRGEALPWSHVVTVTSHVAVGAVILLTCVLLTAASFRCHRAAVEAPAPEPSRA